MIPTVIGDSIGNSRILMNHMKEECYPFAGALIFARAARAIVARPHT